MAKESQVSHGELVERITKAYEQMDGEAMAQLWNDMSNDPVRYLGDSMYAWEEEPKRIPKCSHCNGEVELSGDGPNVDCHFCGLTALPAFYDNVPSCIFCGGDRSGLSLALTARYLVSKASYKIWEAACIKHASEAKRRGDSVRIHPKAKDFASMDDLRP